MALPQHTALAADLGRGAGIRLWHEFSVAAAAGGRGIDAADLCSLGEEAIQHGTDRNRGIGETITVDCGESAATLPTVEFLEHDAFNIVGESRLAYEP